MKFSLKKLFLFLLLFLFLYIKLALSVSFEASVDPASIEGGKPNQFLNFSINDTGVANITEVNISLPSGFILSESGFGSTSCAYKSLTSSSIVWTNASPSGCIDNSTIQYFWVYVETPPSIDQFNFTIYTTDTDNIQTSKNVSISLYDITSPKYSNNISYPSSPTQYSYRRNYWFNISWVDNVAIDKVLFEQNFTTLSSSLENVSLSNETSTYYFNITDLPSGIYVFKWYANDTNNTVNSTPQFIYEITKADNIVNIWFNQTKDRNITVTNKTALNITGTISCNQSNCNISIIRDSNTILLPSTPAPASVIDTLYSTNLHNYTITTYGNQNYTSNSSTYFVMVVPNYSTYISIPSSYSSTSSFFNISFSSPPGFELFLESDYSGSPTRYTMSNYSLTSYSHKVVLPAGSFYWQMYGNYSKHIFNLTSSNTFTIQKASPSLRLTVSPSWIVYYGNRTNVSCSSPYVSVNLYRNHTKVNNPDSQILSKGSYLYVCNTTGNANYSSQSISNILKIIIPPVYVADLSFTEVESLIYITQNSSNSSLVKVKNIGNKTQTISFLIENIDSSWYSINSTKVTLSVNEETAFLITFSIGDIKIGNYSGKFKVNSTEKTISSEFVLKVLPSESLIKEIEDSLKLYEEEYVNLLKEIAKKKEEGYNVSVAEKKLVDLKSLIDKARSYLENKKYYEVYEMFDEIKTLLDVANNELKLAEKIPAPSIFQPTNWLIYGGIVTGCAALILIYLFWPTEEVAYEKVKPTKKEDLFEKLKKLFKKEK